MEIIAVQLSKKYLGLITIILQALLVLILATLHFIGFPIVQSILIILLGLSAFILVFQKKILSFYLLSILIPVEIGVYLPQLSGATITPLVLISISFLTLIIVKVATTHSYPRIPLFGLWLGFILFSFFAYIQSPLIENPLQGLWSTYRVVFVAAIVYPAYWFIIKDRQQNWKVLSLLAASASVSGLIAILQTLSRGELLSGMMTNGRMLGFLFPFPPNVIEVNPIVLRAHFYIDNIFRAHGTFYRTNGFGAFMCIVIGLTWGLMRGSTGRKRLVYIGMLILQITGTIVTFSRSAWAAVIVSLGSAILVELLFSGNRKLKKRLIQLLILIIFIGGVIVTIAMQNEAIASRFATIFNPSQVPQLSWRIDIWREAINIIRDDPIFGTGIDTVVSLPVSGGEESFGAHNLFIGIGYKVGLIVLFVFIILLGILIYDTAIWFFYSREHKEKMLALGVFAGTIAFLVAGFGSAIMEIDNIAALFWLMLAIAVHSRISTNVRIRFKTGFNSVLRNV